MGVASDTKVERKIPEHVSVLVEREVVKAQIPIGSLVCVTLIVSSMSGIGQYASRLGL